MSEPSASFLQLTGASLARPSTAEGGAVQELSLQVVPGKFTVLAGDEAAGKGAAFRLLGLLEPPSAGEVLVEGRPSAAWTSEARAELRATSIGFLFSAGFLLPSLTAVENVAMPVLRRPEASPEEVRQHVETLLDFVGITEDLQVPVGRLGFVEQYRVALARALAHEPRALLVEELDETLMEEDLEALASLLRRVARERGTTVFATVSLEFPRTWADHYLLLAEGHLQPKNPATETPFS